MPRRRFAEPAVRLLRRLVPQTLAWRVFALYAATLLLFVAVGLATFYRYQFQQHIEEEHDTAGLVTEILAHTVSESAVIGDYDTIRKTLDKTIQQSRFSSATFIDMKGGMIRAAHKQTTAAPAPDWVLNRVTAQLFDINQVLSVGGQDYGVLRLSFDARLIASKLWHLGLVALGMALAGMVAGLLLLRIMLVQWLGAFDKLDRFGLPTSGERADGDLNADALPAEFRRTFGVLQRTAANLEAQRLEAAITLEAIHDGVLTLNQAGQVLLANPAAGQILGQTDLVGRNLYALVPELAETTYGAGLQAGWRSRRLERPVGDHAMRVIDTTLSVVAHADHNHATHVFVLRDITESHGLEAQLHHQLAVSAGALKTLRSALERLTNLPQPLGAANGDDIETVSSLLSELISAREADRHALDNQKFALDQHAIVSITDREGLIVYANDQLCHATGYPREALLGTPLLRFNLSPDESSQNREIARTVLEGNVWKGELCTRKNDGKLLWVSATVVPLADASGVPQQFIAIQTDITALKATEAALHKTAEMAEAANRAKSEFLANMSHEIRTPMNGILGMTDLALETTLTAEQRDLLSIVRSSGDSLLTIINDILDFSKIEAGHLSMEVLPFSLRENLADTLDILASTAQHKGLELLCSIDPHIPDQLMGDPGRLRQIVTNLVGNALKFTARGEVRLSASLETASADTVRLKIAVSDTGIGIPKDKVDRLFKPFSQVDASTTREHGGTGLGLSICRQLSEMMNGQIGVDSTPGLGSTFWFTCELAIGAASGPAQSADLLRGKRVLVVDPNLASLGILEQMLKRWGATVYAQADPLAVFSQVLHASEAREGFDLIVLNRKMPGVTALELGAALQTQVSCLHPVPRIVMLTSISQREDPAQLQQAGIALTLSKPVRESLLYRNLQSLMANTPVAPQADVVPNESENANWRQARILLVEDNAINRQLALRLLAKLGHETHTANNGLEALDALRQHTFDVVLMDCQMPEMDGYTATREIRSHASTVLDHDIPVIALTANAMKGDREKVLSAGMNDYLTKPIQLSELSRTIDAWLQVSRRQAGTLTVPAPLAA